MSLNIKKVPENSLSKLDQSCPLCEQTEKRERTVLLQSDPEVWMLKCPNCHGESSERIPDNEFLKKIYDPANYSSSLTFHSNLSNRCADLIINKLDKNFFKNRENITILDYGGSNGSLSKAIIRRIKQQFTGDVKAEIVDLFEREGEDNISFITVENFFAEDKKKYDILLASAVLEHLEKPVEVFEKIIHLASHGSLIYCRTPYDVPLHKLTSGYKVKWPRHLHDLGPKFWRFISEKYQDKLSLIKEEPSIVETDFFSKPLATTVASFFKILGKTEKSILRTNCVFWPYIGGWQVFYLKK